MILRYHPNASIYDKQNIYTDNIEKKIFQKQFNVVDTPVSIFDN